MPAKHISLLMLMLVASVFCRAQDKIYGKDGSIIDGKVKAIAGNRITYKRAGNADGPDRTINKKEVVKIIYQNGVTETFEAADRGPGKFANKWKEDDSKMADYGNNIISIIPGAFTADLDGTMTDPGVGISYERLLDKHGHISFTLPVLINFLSDRDFNSNNYVYGPAPYSVNASGYTSVSIMPGIKLYPASKSHVVRYALGASFFTMFGREPMFVYDYNSSSTADYHYSVYGLMITNSLNVSPGKHFSMSLDFNGAVPVSDNRRANTDNIDIFIAPIIQFVFKVGYRF